MEDYTKYIILSHLHWIEKGITEEEISKSYTEIKDKDIFSGVKMHQIQENMGYKVNYKEVITASDYEKIKFLWLSLSSSKIDLSFVKFCTNLEEINIGCFNEVNLDVLRENTKLKYVIANGNKLQNGGSNTAYGASFTTGDVIGVAYDADAGTLVFYKNNIKIWNY